MQSDKTSEAIRVVIDETSFDFSGRVAQELEAHLDSFNDEVLHLRHAGISAWKPPMFEATACLDGYELYDYLMSEQGVIIDRDTRYAFFGLIDKCPEWNPSLPECDEVSFADESPALALSASLALTFAVMHRRGVACLVFGACPRRGFVSTGSDLGQADLFFFSNRTDLPVFWRSLFALEDVPEAEFFTLAQQAFPKLCFHPDLNFRKFDGTYDALRDPVVTHLGVLNDHFLTVYQAENGIARRVEAALAALGCAGVSPESPNTHKSERLMRQRDVSYGGAVVRCEWHTKIEPHRNRIHFGFENVLGAAILIGIFVDHLDT